jgi:soluble lytic murein transglycosylase-like protein
MSARRRLLRPAAALGAALLITASAASAAVYTFTDEDGVVHYTNVPNDPKFRKVRGMDPPPPPSSRITNNPRDDRYVDEIERLASGHGVDSALVRAVVKAESNFDNRAISRAGALGLMQLMPETARLRNVSNPFNPLENLEGGIRHLKYLLSVFGDTRLALAAYNAGENAVRKYNGIPPYPETRNYVSTVLSHYDRFCAPGATAADAGTKKTAARQEQIYTFVGEDGVKVFTNVPWRYQGSSEWRRQ